MAIDLSGWEKVITNIAKQMHEGTLKPGELDRDAVLKTFNNLNEAGADGYGKGWQDSGVKQVPSREALLMQRNLYKFSGAKTYSMMEELNSKLVKDGRLITEKEFLAEALKINKDYNLNHAQAEYQTTQQSAKMAVVWEAAQRNKARFPNLKFKTQQEDKVSDEHRKLNDIIAAIDGEFWKTHFPPLRFRCRCYTVQTAEQPSDKIPTVEIPDGFKNNVGITNQVFDEDSKKPHPFFQMSKRNKEVIRRIEKGYDQMFRDDLRAWAKQNLIKKSIEKKGVGKIKFTNKGIKEAINQPHKNKLEKDYAIYNIEQLIQDGEPMKVVEDSEGRPFKWHYFKNTIGGKVSYTVFREDLQTGDLTFYTIVDNIK